MTHRYLRLISSLNASEGTLKSLFLSRYLNRNAAKILHEAIVLTMMELSKTNMSFYVRNYVYVYNYHPHFFLFFFHFSSFYDKVVNFNEAFSMKC